MYIPLQLQSFFPLQPLLRSAIFASVRFAHASLEAPIFGEV